MPAGGLVGNLAAFEQLHEGRAADPQQVRRLLGGQTLGQRSDRDALSAAHRLHHVDQDPSQLRRQHRPGVASANQQYLVLIRQKLADGVERVRVRGGRTVSSLMASPPFDRRQLWYSKFEISQAPGESVSHPATAF